MVKVTVGPDLKQELEPQEGLKFYTPTSKKIHFNKHVLASKEREAWEELLNDINTSPKSLQNYEKEISEAAYEVTSKGICHLHTMRKRLTSKNLKYEITNEVIYGWHISKRIFFVLARFVRKPNPERYRIITGYRTHRGVSNKKFHSEMKKKAFDRNFTNGEKPLADHSQLY